MNRNYLTLLLVFLVTSPVLANTALPNIIDAEGTLLDKTKPFTCTQSKLAKEVALATVSFLSMQFSGDSPVELNTSHDIVLSKRDGLMPSIIVGWQKTTNALKSLDQYSQIEKTTSSSMFQKIEFAASLEDFELSIEAHLVTQTEVRSSIYGTRAYMVSSTRVEKIIVDQSNSVRSFVFENPTLLRRLGNSLINPNLGASVRFCDVN